MIFDLDRFYKEDYNKFYIRPEPGMDIDGLGTAEELLISLSVLQRMGVKCDDLLEGARNTLAAAYVKERGSPGVAETGAEAVKVADILVERFEKRLNAALDAAMGEQRSR
jgi:hypothetical protein